LVVAGAAHVGVIGASPFGVGRINAVAVVAQRIVDTRQKGPHQLVVVVSAMYGETDRLIQLARHFSDTHQNQF
jgi:aspartokinase